MTWTDRHIVYLHFFRPSYLLFVLNKHDFRTLRFSYPVRAKRNHWQPSLRPWFYHMKYGGPSLRIEV